MASIQFSQNIFNSLRFVVANRSNAAGLAKEFSEMFNLEINLVRTMQSLDLTYAQLKEASIDLPNPDADPLLDEENRTKFVTNIINLSDLTD